MSSASSNSRNVGLLPLAPGTLLHGRYEIRSTLGTPGGFGVVYLARDTTLSIDVAVKEYLPRELASRASDAATVLPHTAQDADLFQFGITKFVEEAQMLARFDHAHIVRVRDYFEANRTAYLVMDYYEGKTLKEYLAEQPEGRMEEGAAAQVMLRVLDGLREVHRQGVLHRDVKPSNIYLTREGRPILIDFGAARVAVGERSRSLSVVMTPGYAPYEQYQRRGKQGPWTDVYGCGATLYRMVVGEAPPDAADRVFEEVLAPPSEAAGVSVGLSRVIERALAVRSGERPQTAEAMHQMLRKVARDYRSASIPRKETRENSQSETVTSPKIINEVSLEEGKKKKRSLTDGNQGLGNKPLQQQQALGEKTQKRYTIRLNKRVIVYSFLCMGIVAAAIAYIKASPASYGLSISLILLGISFDKIFLLEDSNGDERKEITQHVQDLPQYILPDVWLCVGNSYIVSVLMLGTFISIFTQAKGMDDETRLVLIVVPGVVSVLSILVRGLSATMIAKYNLAYKYIDKLIYWLSMAVPFTLVFILEIYYVMEWGFGVEGGILLLAFAGGVAVALANAKLAPWMQKKVHTWKVILFVVLVMLTLAVVYFPV